MQSKVMKHEDSELLTLGGGSTRRVLVHLPQQMICEIACETGGAGPAHRHPHTQCSYVKSGEFVFTIEGVDFPVKEGDTLAFAPNELHGCRCVKAGVLVDVFTPAREDFLPQSEK